MPGFDVSLPGGYTKEYGSAYQKGKLVIFEVGGVEASVRVDWEPGGLSDDAEVALARRTLAVIHRGKQRALEISTPVTIAGPERTRSWATRAGAATSWTTEITCGARRVALVTLSDHWGVESLHRRVAATFRCHPDEAKERAMVTRPSIETLPPGQPELRAGGSIKARVVAGTSRSTSRCVPPPARVARPARS